MRGPSGSCTTAAFRSSIPRSSATTATAAQVFPSSRLSVHKTLPVGEKPWIRRRGTRTRVAGRGPGHPGPSGIAATMDNHVGPALYGPQRLGRSPYSAGGGHRDPTCQRLLEKPATVLERGHRTIFSVVVHLSVGDRGPGWSSPAPVPDRAASPSGARRKEGPFRCCDEWRPTPPLGDLVNVGRPVPPPCRRPGRHDS